MLIPIALMVTGIFIGFKIIKQKERVSNILDPIISLNIFLIIFFMGTSIGSNKDILNSITNIGIRGIIYGTAGVLGCILFFMIIEKVFFNE